MFTPKDNKSISNLHRLAPKYPSRSYLLSRLLHTANDYPDPQLQTRMLSSPGIRYFLIPILRYFPLYFQSTVKSLIIKGYLNKQLNHRLNKRRFRTYGTVYGCWRDPWTSETRDQSRWISRSWTEVYTQAGPKSLPALTNGHNIAFLHIETGRAMSRDVTMSLFVTRSQH